MASTITREAKRYGLAILCVTAGLAPCLAAQDKYVTPIALLAAVLVTVRLAGRGPGLLATALSVLSAAIFFGNAPLSPSAGNFTLVETLLLLGLAGAGSSLLAGRSASAAPTPGAPIGLRTHRTARARARALGILAFLIAVLVAFVVALRSSQVRQDQQQRSLTHTLEVTNGAAQLLISLVDVETGQRGYLLSHERKYLEPYARGILQQAVWRKSLRNLTRDEPEQQRRLDSIDRLTAHRLALSAESISQVDRGGKFGAPGPWDFDEGKGTMDAIRDVIGSFTAAECALVQRKTAALASQEQDFFWILSLGTGALVATIAVLGIVVGSQARKRQAAVQLVGENERRMNFALQAARVGAWDWDVRTDQSSWSEEMWDLFGLAPHSSEPSFAIMCGAVHPADRLAFEQQIGEATRSGADLSLAFRIGDSNGTPRWLESRGRAARNRDGQVARYSGIVLDVSTVKQLEAERERSARMERQNVVLGLAHAFITTPDGVITFWSTGAVRLYGWLVDEAVGHKSQDLLKTESSVSRVEVERLLFERGSWEGSVRQLCGDGRTISVASHWSVYRDAQGQIEGIVQVNNDISALEAVRELLGQSEKQFRTLAEAIPNLCWMARADGSISWFNQRWYEYTGCTFEQMEGWGWQSVHDPEMLPAVIEQYRASIASGDPLEVEFRLRRADGIFRWFLTRSVPVRDQAGKVQRWFGTATDISDRVAVENQARELSTQLGRQVVERTWELQAAAKELESFAYSVAHDLRAPLRGIDGWSLALLEDYGETLDPKAHGFLDRVRSEAQRMGLLIDDMLQLSCVTRSEMKRQTVDLTELAQRVADRSLKANPERNIDFVIVPGLTTDGDPELLEILMTNLIDNAVKFTGRRPRARIEFGRTLHDGKPAFYIRDDGAGFDMAYAADLFAPFHRLHKPSEFPGTGIGLATVERVIRRHGGKVWGEGQPGVGATFYFTIGANT